jgi:hypothetical protein
MGWWNQTIYGGDEPLKWQGEIYGFCNYEIYGKNNKVQPIPVDLLSKKINDIVSFIESKSGEYNSYIGFQVLGAILMHSGFNINGVDGLSETIINSTDEDEYAKENTIRKNVMRNFKKLIQDFDPSQPVNVQELIITKEPEEPEDALRKEFKIIFDLIKARKRKLEKGKGESSGNAEYDEGFADASQEEVDFLTDFTELLSKMEMMGVLFEKISENISAPSASSGQKISSSPSGHGSGRDVMPG